MKHKLLLCLLPFFCSFSIYAQKPIIINDGSESINICESASFFEDKKGNLPFKIIQKQTFTPNKRNAFFFSFSPSVFWFRFQIENQSKVNQNHWYFLWSDGLNNHVDLYLPQPEGNYKILKGGILTKASEKTYQGTIPLYKLGLVPNSGIQTYYVRIKAGGSLNGQLTLLTHQAVMDRMPTMLAMVWLVIGIQLLRVLYNIILARYIRNVAFRWYSFHTVIVTLSVLGSFGVTGSVLSNYPAWGGFFNSIFYQLMPATYTLFVYALLNVSLNYPRLRWIFLFIIGSSFLQVPLYFIVPQDVLLIFHNYLFLFTEAFLSSICIYSLVKRLPMNEYLLIPCFFTLIPFIFLNLSALGYINYGWIYPMIYITNFLEIVALALVLGKIIQTTENERLSTEKALYKEKVESEKLAELDVLKTRFFTNISHEFRTPLTLLVGPLADLQKRYPTESMIPTMQRNLRRLQNLINQLLDLSKLEAKQLKPELSEGDIAVLFQQLFASFESLAQNRAIFFHYEQSNQQFSTFFDTDKIEKIVTNLLSNAFKFTPEKGRIVVRVDYTESELILKVQDYGIGIAPERLPRIFDRFYQAQSDSQRNYEGTGIGLALVKELIEVLNGQITVESELGKGTTFIVTLPLQKVALNATLTNVSMAITKKSVEMDSFNPKSADSFMITDTTLPLLLVVEDNPDLRAYIKTIFQESYQLIEATDGQDGLEKAVKQVPDIIISDLMMPRLDGLGFCQALKTDIRTNHIPVVMLTAKVTLDDRLEGFKTGADDYLSKPFSRQELEVRVENLLKQREILRQKYSKQTTDPTSIVLEKKVSSLDEIFLNKLQEVIHLHLDDSSFEVEQLCKEMGMSRTNLHRKLKAIINQSTTEFVRKTRLRQAALLLQQRTFTVSEIAYQVGFESLPYFSKSFQEEFGASPSEYARKNT